MKLNILAINANRLLLAPFEVKILASEPSFFSFNIVDQIKKTGKDVFVVGILVSAILNRRKEERVLQN